MTVPSSLTSNDANFKIIKHKLHNNYILLVLQVPKDANMILHSPNFSNHLDIVKWTLLKIYRREKLSAC